VGPTACLVHSHHALHCSPSLMLHTYRPPPSSAHHVVSCLGCAFALWCCLHACSYNSWNHLLPVGCASFTEADNYTCTPSVYTHAGVVVRLAGNRSPLQLSCISPPHQEAAGPQLAQLQQLAEDSWRLPDHPGWRLVTEGLVSHHGHCDWVHWLSTGTMSPCKAMTACVVCSALTTQAHVRSLLLHATAALHLFA
jgi:hypothetical protein